MSNGPLDPVVRCIQWLRDEAWEILEELPGAQEQEAGASSQGLTVVLGKDGDRAQLTCIHPEAAEELERMRGELS